MLPNVDTFQSRCSVCNRKITKNQKQKSLACSDCKTFVHRKCSNISQNALLNSKASHLKHWSCNTCMASFFPFQETDLASILKLTYNSLVDCPCLQSSTEMPTTHCEEFRLTTNFYDNDSIYTHAPDPHNNMDMTLDINARCDYYTNHDFHKLTTDLDKDGKPFSVLHSNIESLMHNFDGLEILCTNLKYSFDIIGLTET